MNLYQFSQENNNEMGIHFTKEEDPELYKKTNEEVQRLLEISDEIIISIKKVEEETPLKTETKLSYKPSGKNVSTSALAKEMKISSKELFAKFEKLGLITKNFDEWELTKRGEKMGGQIKNGQYGQYIAWAENIKDIIDMSADDLPL
ncbi:MAG: hypothetical protein LBM68_03170 [Bacteroidales bacterium]|jgi:hypothetical protein|nr:hypothetical protein [Bacteroidales bacterium]